MGREPLKSPRWSRTLNHHSRLKNLNQPISSSIPSDSIVPSKFDMRALRKGNLFIQIKPNRFIQKIAPGELVGVRGKKRKSLGVSDWFFKAWGSNHNALLVNKNGVVVSIQCEDIDTMDLANRRSFEVREAYQQRR